MLPVRVRNERGRLPIQEACGQQGAKGHEGGYHEASDMCFRGTAMPNSASSVAPSMSATMRSGCRPWGVLSIGVCMSAFVWNRFFSRGMRTTSGRKDKQRRIRAKAKVASEMRMN